jgi:hypothetical protein
MVCKNVSWSGDFTAIHWTLIRPWHGQLLIKNDYLQPYGAFHSHGGTPIAGWFLRETEAGGWQNNNNRKGDGMPGLLEADELKNYKKQTPDSLGLSASCFYFAVPFCLKGQHCTYPPCAWGFFPPLGCFFPCALGRGCSQDGILHSIRFFYCRLRCLFQTGCWWSLFVAILVAFNLFDLLSAPAKSGWVADINVTVWSLFHFGQQQPWILFTEFIDNSSPSCACYSVQPWHWSPQEIIKRIPNPFLDKPWFDRLSGVKSLFSWD